MDRTGERERLIQWQSEVVRAISGNGICPAGFDERKLTAARDALLKKRERTCRRACALLEGLGEDCSWWFAKYARVTILKTASPCQDACGFVRFLIQEGYPVSVDLIRWCLIHEVRSNSKIVCKSPAKVDKKLHVCFKLGWLCMFIKM